MPFTDHFIHRPVWAIVVSCLLLLLGLQAGSMLQVRQFPALEEGKITVATFYPGANAETVQGFVTTPLQRRIASAQGVDFITSESVPGESWIEANLRLGTDTNAALAEIIAKVREARWELPADIEDPVVTTDVFGNALMYLRFNSKELSITQLHDYVMRAVQPELVTVPGVGAADITGSGSFAMRVWLDPERMSALGVTAQDVRDALRESNYISAAGTVKGNLVQATVDARTGLRTAEEFGRIVVRQQGERRVLLQDVARVELGSNFTEAAAFAGPEPSVFVSIRAAPDANPLEVAHAIHELMPRLTSNMPADVTGTVHSDASIYIEQSMVEVVKTLLEAVAIVVLVIYLFLGYLRVVLIPLVAIPLSLIGVLFPLYLLGFSINMLTMLALVIAIGLVVDDAIVVVENVDRRIQEGELPLQAALLGARQVAIPVVSMSFTLAAVFAPIGFMGGLTGTLFSEFALTLAGAVVVSGIVALTLSPVMCARLLADHEHQGRYAEWLDRAFRKLRQRYQHALGYCLDNRGAVLMFAAFIIASLPLLQMVAQQELAPEEDTGVIFMVATPPQYANVDYVSRFTAEMNPIWQAMPEAENTFQINTDNWTFGGLLLKPWDQRERTQQEIQQEFQAGLNRISGLEIFTFGDSPLPGGASGLPVNFVIGTTDDYRALEEVSEQVLAAARESGLFMFVRKSLNFSRPEVSVDIDRELAARLGISMEDIGQTLATMLGDQDAGRFNLEGRSYEVIPQAGKSFRLTREWLERYHVRTADGELVPLSTLVTLGRTTLPNKLTQFQQLNSVNIEGMAMPGTSLGTALDFLARTTEAIAPPGYRIDYGGESRRYMQEQPGFVKLFALSLLVIFLVLAAQFNSLRDPLVVLLAVPMSVFGAAVPIALGFATLNIYTQVGLVTLIGLISKHGILIVDFANHLVQQGMDRKHAVMEAASLRLRPILMTTVATVLGVLPLLAATGAGANSRFSIGLVIASGMTIGTLFTLFVVPAFYLPLRKARGKQPASTPAAAIGTD